MEPPVEPPDGAEAGEDALDMYLLRLYDSLHAQERFASEGERMRWVWRVHQLQRRRQLAPARWEGLPASLLDAIEVEIGVMQTDDEGSRQSDEERKSDQAHGRASIPVMETADDRESRGEAPPSSWTVLSRLLRRASEALMGPTMQPERKTEPGVDDSVVIDVRGDKEELLDFDERYERGDSSESFKAAATATGAGLRKLESDEGTAQKDAATNRSSRGGSDGSGRSLRQSVPGLLRSFVSYMGLSMEETFLCQICYDFVPVSTSVSLANCHHSFCRACLQNYLEFKISEAQVYPTCFYQPKDSKERACSTEIAVEDIRSLISEDAWQKYNKFKFNKENELARQCPFCDHSQVCAGPDDPACTCEACGREFCFLHSNAHEGRTCAEYDKKMIALEKLNNALISEIAKPCPGCQNHVEKTGGCNQMKCVVCNTSFCWICLAVIDDNVFPEHFQWWNVRGCAGNQMADVEQQSRSEKVFQVILRFGFFIVFGPPALALAIVFCILCCFFQPCTRNGRMTFRHAFTTCFCISGYALLAPFVLAAGLAALGVVLGGAALIVCVVLALSPFICLFVVVKFDRVQAGTGRT